MNVQASLANVVNGGLEVGEGCLDALEDSVPRSDGLLECLVVASLDELLDVVCVPLFERVDFGGVRSHDEL